MKKLLSLLLIIVMSLSFIVSCDTGSETTKLKIGFMSGPTGMGMAKLIHDNGGTDGNEKYEFIAYTDASLATADLKAGKIDMACIPTNAAAAFYNTNGGIKTLAVNCLNTLYIMTRNGTVINTLADLEGKTIYTIENGTPKAILQYLLDSNNINATIKTTIGDGEDEKTIAAPTDLAPLLIQGQSEIEIALVPEPVATQVPIQIAAQAKDHTYTVAIDLDTVTSNIAMGCIVASDDAVNNNKDAVDSFLAEYKASIEYISDQSNIDSSAQYICDAGILTAVPVAKKAIANLNDSIAYVSGSEMKALLVDFYNSIGMKWIGGKLPADEFYY